jgi:hypothetical protein
VNVVTNRDLFAMPLDTGDTVPSIDWKKWIAPAEINAW